MSTRQADDGRPVSFGVLGIARIATERVVPAMQEAPRCRVRAMASRDPGRASAAAEALHIERAYGSYAALLEDRDIEAVYLPLPNHEHVRWAVAALEAGKHVLCEKPLAVDAASAMPLVEARDRTGLLVEEAFMVRDHPQWRAARQLIADGAIGSPRFIHASYCHTVESPADIRLDPAAGGGALLDVGCYVAAAMRLLLGREPVRARAVMTLCPDTGVDLDTHGTLQFADGTGAEVTGTFTVSIRASRRQALEVIGTDGWLRLTVPFAHPPHLGATLQLGGNEAPGTVVARTVDFEPMNQYTLQAERFARLVRGEPAPCWPLEDALANLRCLDALRQAHVESRWVDVSG